MWLNLEINGIVLKLIIKDYVKSTKYNWDDCWCSVEANFSSYFLNYQSHGCKLLSAEIDELTEYIDDILNSRLHETKKLEFLEPDLTFVFYPKHDLKLDSNYTYVKERHEIKDISMDIIISFWYGGITENTLQLKLYIEEIQNLMCYLQFIKGIKKRNDADIQNLIVKEILLPCYV